MLEERPGRIMLMGKEDRTPVHDACYDFDDAVLGHSIAIFGALIEMRMPFGAESPSAFK